MRISNYTLLNYHNITDMLLVTDKLNLTFYVLYETKKSYLTIAKMYITIIKILVSISSITIAIIIFIIIIVTVTIITVIIIQIIITFVNSV